MYKLSLINDIYYRFEDDMLEVKRGRGYVYAIQYHVVWCMKY